MDPRQEQLPLYQTELKKQLPGCCNIAIRLWIPLMWNTVLKYTCCSSSLFISGFYLTSELFSWLVLSPSCWSSVLLHVHHTAEHISLSSLLLYIHRRSPYLSASKLRRRSTDLLWCCFSAVLAPEPGQHSTLHSSLCSFTNDDMALELQSKQRSNPHPKNAGWTCLFSSKNTSLQPGSKSKPNHFLISSISVPVCLVLRTHTFFWHGRIH